MSNFLLKISPLSRPMLSPYTLHLYQNLLQLKDVRETSKNLRIKTKIFFSKKRLDKNIKPIC